MATVADAVSASTDAVEASTVAMAASTEAVAASTDNGAASADAVREWGESDTTWLADILAGPEYIVDARREGCIAELFELWSQQLRDAGSPSGWALRAPSYDLLQVPRSQLYTDPVLRAGVTLSYWSRCIRASRAGWAECALPGILADPCAWCGEPTCLLCDECDEHPVCSDCDSQGWEHCRACADADPADHPAYFFA